MKRFLFITSIMAILSFLASPVFADTIVTTGNATAQSSVYTSVSGGGTVNTHIEVDANGEKKVVDSNQPDDIDVSVTSNGNTTITPEEKNISPTATTSPTIKPSRSPSVPHMVKDDIGSLLKKFFGKIFSFFKFH